jgi:von Willebrand factor type A domain
MMTSVSLRRLLGSFALLAPLLTAPADATVNLRVEGRPPTDPIQVFVRVSNGGAPITNLTYQDFEIVIDPAQGGIPEQITAGQFTSPQSGNASQHVSVVFVMDYTSSVTSQFLPAMQTAVIDFINAMTVDDMAAIIKFNNDSGAQVVQPFLAIDGGANNDVLTQKVAEAFPGDGSNILDAAHVGVQQFSSTPLPEGPKAVILVTDGRDSHSSDNEDTVIEAASNASIPIFTIAVGNPLNRGFDLLTSLAAETGGEYFDATNGDAEIAAAYESVRLLLTGEYLIEIPNGITDCAQHQLQVTVQGTETATAPFTRRTCNTTPNAFAFTSQTDVAPGTVVTSNAATVTGIEAPAHISVIGGSYSIGCTNQFTNAPSTIADGEDVCVQQTASSKASTSKTTTLTVGGLAVTFTTTTRGQSGGGGGGGGGGTTGVPELLLGLGALVLARRRRAA